jgi:hypothetical protein
LRQGSVLSTILFNAMMNEIANKDKVEEDEKPNKWYLVIASIYRV